MLETGLLHDGPAAVRYPRDTIPDTPESTEPLELGKGVIRRQGNGTALLVFGPLLHNALEAAEEINATVVDMRFVSPLDQALLLEIAQFHTTLVTLEENVITGGAGSAVNEFLLAERCNLPILNLGLPNRFVEQGERDTLLGLYQLDVHGILDSISQFLA